MLPRISVVVLNWNGKKFIDPFISSFIKQKYPASRLELIFTDNNSSDDSVQYVNEVYGHMANLKIVQNKDNYGYAGGNNRGIKEATGDYVLICNNDLELDDSLIKELVKVAGSCKAAVTTPKLMFLNRRGVINNAGSRIESSNPWPIHEIGANEKDSGQYEEIREITAFCGACILVSRKFLENVGMFDEKFFMYFEDGDLSWRGQKAGFKYFYAPKAIAYHYHTGTSKEGSPLFNHYVGRNRLLILVKNARSDVVLKGIYVTLRDHLVGRLRNIVKALLGRGSAKHALHEFYLSQKMLWDFTRLLPYVLLKRWGILPEEKL
jgi:GT2 family glycosyltransferase